MNQLIEESTPSITLSEDQDKAISSLSSWYEQNKDKRMLITLGGLAGTGKTTVLNYLRKELDKDLAVAFLAFTGKAVSVMNRKIRGTLGYYDLSSTIHSYLYRPVIDSHGNIKEWRVKTMAKDKADDLSDPTVCPYIDLFIIDEASMVPRELFDELVSFGKPIIAVGDHGQLPPVKSNFSLMLRPDLRLEQIHRQAKDNPILTLAHMAREGKKIDYGKISDNVQVISNFDYPNSPAEEIVNNPGKDSFVIVSTNRARVSTNTKTLRFLRGGSIESIVPKKGERLICLKNNHEFGIYNGMLCTVVDTNLRCSFNPEHNFRTAVEDDFGKHYVLNITKHMFLTERAAYPKGVHYKGIANWFDYGYALTCHKAQGSEIPNAVIIGTGFGDADLRRRWLYTAITRATKKCYLVK